MPRNWHRGAPGLKVAEALEQLEHLQQREAQLIEQLRLMMQRALSLPVDSDLGIEDDFAKSCQQVGVELEALDRNKLSAITVLRHAHTCESIELALSTQSFLTVVQQPPEVAVANRYLLPPPTVTVVLPPRFAMNGDRTFVVRAQLAYTTSEAPLQLTLDGKQDVLQGVIHVPIDKHRRGVFQKLKIMEVSSKHQHRLFCLVFRLIECHHGRQILHSTEVRSAGFQVQSRPHKRKRGGESPVYPAPFPISTAVRKSYSVDSAGSSHLPPSLLESYSGMDDGRNNLGYADSSSVDTHRRLLEYGGVGQHSMHSSSTTSSSSRSRSKSKSDRYADVSSQSDSSSDDDDSDNPLSNGGPNTSNWSPNDVSIVDISNLLTSSIADAARKLGIPQAILAKRYLETSGHAWPARKLHKIERMLEAERSKPEDERSTSLMNKLVKKRREFTQHTILSLSPSDFSAGDNAATLDDSSSEDDSASIALNLVGMRSTDSVTPKTSNISIASASSASASPPTAQRSTAPAQHPHLELLRPESAVGARSSAPASYTPSWLPSFARNDPFGRSIRLPSLPFPPGSTPASLQPFSQYPVPAIDGDLKSQPHEAE